MQGLGFTCRPSNIGEIQHQRDCAEDVQEKEEAKKIPLLAQGVDDDLNVSPLCMTLGFLRRS